MSEFVRSISKSKKSSQRLENQGTWSVEISKFVKDGSTRSLSAIRLSPVSVSFLLFVPRAFGVARGCAGVTPVLFFLKCEQRTKNRLIMSRSCEPGAYLSAVSLRSWIMVRRPDG